MRVLHVDTERGWRGGERQVLWLSRELAGRGHESIIAARPGQPLHDRARAEGLRVVEAAPATELDPVAVWRLRRCIQRERIEIVHAHTAHAVALAAIALIGGGATMVVTRRVDFPLRRNAFTRWKYARAAAIVAISNAVADVLRRGGIAPHRITVVPDGTDLNRRIVPLSSSELAALGAPRGAPLAVQVSQLVGHKDPVNFVRAIAVARRHAPTLVGLLAGGGPLRGEVEAEVRALGLSDAVRVLGYRTDADSLLASATVCVLSSREEGMGSVLLDALMLGKPIAATRCGGIPEVVEDEVSGLLAPIRDPEALGRAIARVITEPALASRLAAAARARAAGFSVERMTESTLAVYERVRGGARRDASS